jgi:hypothetical protein
MATLKAVVMVGIAGRQKVGAEVGPYNCQTSLEVAIAGVLNTLKEKKEPIYEIAIFRALLFRGGFTYVGHANHATGKVTILH